MRSSQEEKRKRRLYKHTIKTKDYRVERIQPQVQAQVQCSASLALSTTSTPQQTSCSDCIHVSSQARAPHKACRIAYRQIMDAWFAITIKQRVPADKRSRHAICQTHPSGPFFFPSLLFSCSRSGRGLLSALLIVAKYKARTLFSCTCGCFENGLVSTSASMEMGLISAVRWRRRLSAGKRTIHVRVVRVRERMHTATAMPSLIVPAYRDSRGFVSS